MSQPRLRSGSKRSSGSNSTRLEVVCRRKKASDDPGCHPLRLRVARAHLRELRVGEQLVLRPLDQVVDQERAFLGGAHRFVGARDHPVEDVVRRRAATAVAVGDRVRVAVRSRGREHVEQLPAAGHVGHPLGPADLQRGEVVELRRRRPVGERPHVLGRQPVGAHQRHLFQLLAFGRVEDHPVLAPAQRPVAQAEVGQLSDLGEKVGLEDHLVEGDAEARQRLALSRDHPGTRLRPQFQRPLVPGENAHHQLVGLVFVEGGLAGDRVFGAVVALAGPVAARGDVLGVTEADEVVGLLAVAVLRGEVVVGAPGGDDPRHRLAHAAADVADQAAVLHPGAADPQRSGDRVAERQVAQVADVERLGRVRAPEVDGIALAGGEVVVRLRVGDAGLECLAPRRDPVVGEADVDSPGVLMDDGDRRVGGDPVERLARPRVRRPVADPRHQHQVAVGLRAERRAGGPRCGVVAPADGPVDAVEKISCHSPVPPDDSDLWNAPAGARTRITGLQVRSFNRLRHRCWLCETGLHFPRQLHIEFPDCSIRGAA